MIWGKKRKRIQQLEAQLANMKLANELLQQMNISLVDRWKKNAEEIFHLRERLSVPLVISSPNRLGPIEILEIKSERNIDLQLVGAATLMACAVVSASLSFVMKRPFKMPDYSNLPESHAFRYRYYDHELNEERTLAERDFKRTLNERGIL